MLFLSPSEDVKMGAGQPHEVPATTCKHHLRALLISQVRSWRHQLPTAGTEAGVASPSGLYNLVSVADAHGAPGARQGAICWYHCVSRHSLNPAQHSLDAKLWQLPSQSGPELTQASLAPSCAPGRGAWG